MNARIEDTSLLNLFVTSQRGILLSIQKKYEMTVCTLLHRCVFFNGVYNVSFDPPHAATDFTRVSYSYIFSFLDLLCKCSLLAVCGISKCTRQKVITFCNIEFQEITKQLYFCYNKQKDIPRLCCLHLCKFFERKVAVILDHTGCD